MAVEFKHSMKKDELLEIAVMNGIEADDGMTKTQIIDALEAFNAGQAAETAGNGAQNGAEDGGGSGEGNNTTHTENAVQSGAESQQGHDSAADGGGSGDEEDGSGGDAEQDGTEGGQNGAGSGNESGEGNNTTTAEKTAGGEQEAGQGYNLFVYAGPSLPRGRLKENAVFRGTFEDVKAYLADVLEDYPQIERLIVPASKLAAFSVKVKTPGNIAHKYYSDIVSAMRGNKEV